MSRRKEPGLYCTYSPGEVQVTVIQKLSPTELYRTCLWLYVKMIQYNISKIIISVTVIVSYDSLVNELVHFYLQYVYNVIHQGPGLQVKVILNLREVILSHEN